MKNSIRIARIEDAESFMAIKEQLPLTLSDGSTSTGGFLLGTDLEIYKAFIENDYCLVAEIEGKVVGFGIILKDSSVKKSDIWIRRQQATWSIAIDSYDAKKLCYFEQLAFLNGYSREVIKLCYNLLCWVFEQGHEHLFTTTVKVPITNLAAVPYILKGAGALVGNIDEVYPIVGPIVSDIYKIDRADFEAAVVKLSFYPFLEKHYIGF